MPSRNPEETEAESAEALRLLDHRAAVILGGQITVYLDDGPVEGGGLERTAPLG